MILFDNIIQVLALADLNTLVFVAIVLLDSGSVGATFVDVDQAGFAVRTDGFVQKIGALLSYHAWRSVGNRRCCLACRQHDRDISTRPLSSNTFHPFATEGQSVSCFYERPFQCEARNG